MSTNPSSTLAALDHFETQLAEHPHRPGDYVAVDIASRRSGKQVARLPRESDDRTLWAVRRVLVEYVPATGARGVRLRAYRAGGIYLASRRLQLVPADRLLLAPSSEPNDPANAQREVRQLGSTLRALAQAHQAVAAQYLANVATLAHGELVPIVARAVLPGWQTPLELATRLGLTEAALDSRLQALGLNHPQAPSMRTVVLTEPGRAPRLTRMLRPDACVAVAAGAVE